ncbi:hypothetical protein HYH43_07020 [Clostridium botulinum]|uniref:hypothetical protein n=1 Tax=Clostridium botulinum TaxID=1491 RepID=UPI000774777F|nr:hypothetical protein [Clostridium botulinum]MBY6789188.1 hypothetical protein [Clostridium botulinum]MBY6948978.1 hypothetical protein [Clostridium botulinum]MBY7022902.1 hypothetical protein [Clostridium botulinum]NFI33313.1 hypothetical protein [Clostridium botulinum]NFL87452.1 hypothetical protein [Clostridium botulinum]
MLSSSLEKLEKILESCKIKLNNEQIKKLRETLQHYSNGILPTRVLKRELSISFEDTHKLMTFLSTKRILIPKYKIYCDKDELTGASKVYDDPSDIPIKTCDRCEEGCILIERLVVEFKVEK